MYLWELIVYIKKKKIKKIIKNIGPKKNKLK